MQAAVNGNHFFYTEPVSSYSMPQAGNGGVNQQPGHGGIEGTVVFGQQRAKEASTDGPGGYRTESNH